MRRREQARRLDVLGVGDEEAGALGLEVRRMRLVTVVAASLGTAAAVAVSGLIGFVGIIVPHTIRLIFGMSYRVAAVGVTHSSGIPKEFWKMSETNTSLRKAH